MGAIISMVCYVNVSNRNKGGWYHDIIEWLGGLLRMSRNKWIDGWWWCDGCYWELVSIEIDFPYWDSSLKLPWHDLCYHHLCCHAFRILAHFVLIHPQSFFYLLNLFCCNACLVLYAVTHANLVEPLQYWRGGCLLIRRKYNETDYNWMEQIWVDESSQLYEQSNPHI